MRADWTQLGILSCLTFAKRCRTLIPPAPRPQPLSATTGIRACRRTRGDRCPRPDHPWGRPATSGQPCQATGGDPALWSRSEEHTSELQSLMRISYAVFCLKKKHNNFIYNYKDSNTQTPYSNKRSTTHPLHT